ncbi:MAG: response regulator transcription factor [Anaerolineales bacterium]|nr:response regulator transcription factor [Anaerolineales bacterium]
MNQIRVLLVDDHAILREGLRARLELEPDLQVVGEAEDGRAAVEQARQLHPDVVIMDISMPLLNGIEATRQIKCLPDKIEVLVLSMHDDEGYIRQALTAGALGYILKDAVARELIDAIRAINKGEAVLSSAITRLVIEDYLRFGEIRPTDEDDCLTPREREVLQLIAEGYTNKQIATMLNISIKTVQVHRTNMMKKLDLHDRGELIKYAIQKKIIEI